MTTTYTRQQIKAAIRDAEEAVPTCGGPHVGDPEDHQVDALAAALGLTVEAPKPAPGTWHLTRTEGWPAYVDTNGNMQVIEPNGETDSYPSGDNDWPALDPATPPARVVPAETADSPAPVLPDSEDVWNAIVNSRRSDGARLTATQATDAVMSLIEGLNR